MNISVGGCKIVFSPIAIPSEVEGFMLEWKQFRIGVTYFQKKRISRKRRKFKVYGIPVI